VWLCDVWLVQSDGLTPLLVASLNGHVEAVRALVEAGAAVNQAAVSASWGVV
jgi:ankyrin repeat protein